MDNTLLSVAEELALLAERIRELASKDGGGDDTPPPWVDLVDELPRRSTGLPAWFGSNGLRFWHVRDLGEINGIAIHHAAAWASSPRAIADYHVGNKAYPSVAYHYMVWQDGTIYRTADLTWSLWHDHCGGFNKHISVLMNGNFKNENPTDHQLNVTSRLVRWLMYTFSLQPDRVKGHDQWSRICTGRTLTECPGFSTERYFVPLLEAPLSFRAPEIRQFEPAYDDIGMGKEEEL